MSSETIPEPTTTSYSQKGDVKSYNPLQESEKDSYVVFEKGNESAISDCDDDFPSQIAEPYSKKCQSEPGLLSQAAFLYIQMQLCQKDTLREWLKTNHKREKIVIFDYFYQIVDAVDYVHSKQLMHRDLKVSPEMTVFILPFSTSLYFLAVQYFLRDGRIH